MSDGVVRAGRSHETVWAAAFVGVASFAVLVPFSLLRWPISVDAVEYLAIAYNWVEGRGFVNPVMLAFVLDDATPPLPGFATRSLVLPVLLAIPVSLGASLQAVGVVHAAWASLVAAGHLIVARRTMSLAAALATTLAFVWSTGWVVPAHVPITEATALGALLLVISSARHAGRGPWPAFACGLLAVLAWATRPTLILCVPVVVLATIWGNGLRPTLARRSLWLYVGLFVTGWWGVTWLHEAATGFPPYAQYAVLARSFGLADLTLYRAPEGSLVDFLAAHAPQLRASLMRNLAGLGSALFGSTYNFVGWVGLPGLLYAIRLGRRCPPELRSCAVAAVVFLAPIVVMYGPSNPSRYAVLGVASLWIVAGAFLDGAVRALGSRLRSRRAARLPARGLGRTVLRAAPVLLVAAIGLPTTLSPVRILWSSYREHGTMQRLVSWDAPARGFCASVDRAAVVAAGPSPWAFYFWCGNASMWTPRDLDSPASLDAFLREHRPAYVVLDDAQARVLAVAGSRLVRVASRDRWTLFRVRGGGASWSPPPPLWTLGGR